MFKDNRFEGLSASNIKRDIIAGITVGIVAIPLGMAFAIASGVGPEYGLYTTIIAGLIVALFGGSRFQIAGPTGAFIPILLAIVLQYGYENLLIAGFLAGIMLLLMGIFKLGSLIKFIPRSVTIGFTSGIAVIIFSGQIGDFLGLEGLVRKEYFHENMIQIVQNIGTLNGHSILTAALGLLTIILVPRFFPKVPVLLAALLIPTFASILFYPGETATIGSAFGGIPQSFPGVTIPEITWEKIVMLLPSAFVIALLGGIESLLSAVVSDGMTGKRHNSSRELIGQGIANMVTPLFGGIPATGAIARTATNIKSGAVSPVSGIAQSVFVLAILLLFAPYASDIPLAAMAPILMVVAYNMSEHKSFIHILKLRTSDSLVLAATFLLTVFVNLTAAVQVGLLLAAISFVKRMSEVLAVEQIMPQPKNINGIEYATTCSQLSFYNIEGPLFFGAADRFESTLIRSINKRPKVLILKIDNVPIMDATAASHLKSLITDLQRFRGIILIAGANEHVLDMMKASGLYSQIGDDHFFSNSEKALDYGLSLIDVSKCAACSRKGFDSCQVFAYKRELNNQQEQYLEEKL